MEYWRISEMIMHDVCNIVDDGTDDDNGVIMVLVMIMVVMIVLVMIVVVMMVLVMILVVMVVLVMIMVVMMVLVMIIVVILSSQDIILWNMFFLAKL